MAIQTINIGTAPNDGTGDPLRTAFEKTNANVADLDGRLIALDDRTSNVDNTSDMDKPVSTAVQAALDEKEAAGTAAAAVANHVAEPNPHPQYATPAEAAAVAPVQSVAGRAGDVELGVGDISGLMEIVGARNKIINGKFRVNQRGYVSGTPTVAANQYTFDRWRIVTSGQSVTYTPSGNGNIVTAPAGGLEQVIEGINIQGGIFTLSWDGTATATVNGAAIANGGQTASLPANANVTIRFSGGTVSAVQFEAGPFATPFEDRHIAQELALCQRYAFVIENGASTAVVANGQCTSSTAATIVVQGLNMRILPTLSMGPSSLTSAGNSLVAVTGISLGTGSSTGKSVQLNANVASGLVAGDATRLIVHANERLILDAEL